MRKSLENGTKISCSRRRAVLTMALASSLHFAGYEFARSGTIALFTSEKMGFASPSAAPFSTVCVTPFSFLLLWMYTKNLDQLGPRASLKYSSLLFAFLMAFGAFLLQLLETKLSIQVTIFILNVAESGFVQLLCTQHWSFIGSICNQEGAIWFAPIAGIGSVASALAALGISPLVDRIGLIGLLWTSVFFIVASCAAADDAYRISQVRGFEPKLQKKNERKSYTKNEIDGAENLSQHSLIQTSLSLFARVPVLASLCIEVLACQCVSSIVNFLFVLKVKEFIPDDKERAKWTGTCYAWINASSGFLQFAILPFLIKSFNARRLWLLMPCTMMLCATLMSYEKQPSLHLVAATFSFYKTLEYSVRGVTVEMVYVALDYESRFIGKEIIGLFVSRFGKSGMAAILSLVTNVFGSSPFLDKKIVQALSVSSFLWLFASYPLAHTKDKHTDMQAVKDGIYLFFNWLARKLKRVGGER